MTTVLSDELIAKLDITRKILESSNNKLTKELASGILFQDLHRLISDDEWSNYNKHVLKQTRKNRKKEKRLEAKIKRQEQIQIPIITEQVKEDKPKKKKKKKKNSKPTIKKQSLQKQRDVEQVKEDKPKKKRNRRLKITKLTNESRIDIIKSRLQSKIQERQDKSRKELVKQIAEEAATKANKNKLKQVAREAAIKAAKIKAHETKIADDEQAKREAMNLINKQRPKATFNTKDSHYTIETIRRQEINKYRSNIVDFRVSGVVELEDFDRMFRDLIDTMLRGIPNNARVKLSYYIPEQGNTSMRETKLLHIAEATEQFYNNILYVVEYLNVGINNVVFSLLQVELPVGAKKPNKIVNAETTKSIVSIVNTDTMCCVRSIIVCLSRTNLDVLQNIFKGKLTQDEIKNINYRRQEKNYTKINEGIFSANEVVYLRKQEKSLLTILAKAFHRIYEIAIRPTGNDVSDINEISLKTNVQVNVYAHDRTLIYSTNNENNGNKVDLLHGNNHFDAIVNINSFLGKVKQNKCKCCNASEQCVKEMIITCKRCGKFLNSKTCFENHIKNNRCIEHSYRCAKCKKVIKTKDRNITDHICGETKCQSCKQYVLQDHKCFITKKELKEKSEKYIFYDFETYLDKDKKHIVNFGVTQDFNGNELIFTNIDDFCKHFIDKKYKGYTFIAHNSKAYDVQFILEWLVKKGVRPDITSMGNKILSLEIKDEYNIRFIDSISFIPGALKDFPKTFELMELHKGYFPYKFNTIENQNYIGEFPDKSYYGYETMTKDNKKQFDEWYIKNIDKTFNFKEEMYKYCKSDVDILRQGCIKLRELFLRVSNIDPFQYITIASVCLAIYRNDCLEENTICVVDEAPNDTYSIKSIKWMKYLSLKEGIDIRHACNGGEQSIILKDSQKIKVDGYNQQSNTVYQFHGCFYHGCTTCYKENTINKKNNKYMSDLYKNTMRNDEEIRSKGYNLVTIWEHEFDNSEMSIIPITEYDLVEPAKIRDAFFGGRTEPIKLIRDFEKFNEKGKYVDVCSLYPTVMFYDEFPIGHPTKIYKPTKYDPNWFGLIHCKILPPRGLYLPVLPYKQKTFNSHKLMFGLCRRCMELQNKNTCNHTDSERCLTGFWTTKEISKALEKGYQIKEIYEVHNFEKRSTELWKKYIRKFLKIKLETSEFKCSEEEYREDARKLGIELDELKQNSVLRFISKLCLNSLWGKFGQNPRIKHKRYIDDPKEFYSIITNDKYENISVAFINKESNQLTKDSKIDESLAYITYEEKTEFIKTSYNTNVYIACFTASHARLRLYDSMDKLNENTCCRDTDSTVYIENETTKQIVEKYQGDSLGQWTDELKGSYMTYWCSVAAKDYGYNLNNGKSKGKIKGFRVSSETEDKITNDNRVKLINGIVRNIDITGNQFKISNNQLGSIFTNEFIKRWSFNFDKRIIVKHSDYNIDTIPYGF